MQSKFNEAENAFSRNNLKNKSKEMWITLKDFDKAKRITVTDDNIPATPKINGGSTSVIINDKSSNLMLVKQEAEWKEKVGEWKEAGELYIKADELKKAIEIFSKNNYI